MPGRGSWGQVGRSYLIFQASVKEYVTRQGGPGTWDSLLQSLHQAQHSWSYNMRRNYMGLETIVCMHSWGKISTKSYKKDQKTQLPFLKGWEHKVGIMSRSRVLPQPPARNAPPAHPAEQAGGPVTRCHSLLRPARERQQSLTWVSSLAPGQFLLLGQEHQFQYHSTRRVYTLTGRGLLRYKHLD